MIFEYLILGLISVSLLAGACLALGKFIGLQDRPTKMPPPMSDDRSSIETFRRTHDVE